MEKGRRSKDHGPLDRSKRTQEILGAVNRKMQNKDNFIFRKTDTAEFRDTVDQIVYETKANVTNTMDRIKVGRLDIKNDRPRFYEAKLQKLKNLQDLNASRWGTDHSREEYANALKTIRGFINDFSTSGNIFLDRDKGGVFGEHLDWSQHDFEQLLNDLGEPLGQPDEDEY